MATLHQLAAAITKMEGCYPGTRAFRNKNPGNLRFAHQPKAIAQDEKGFAIFETFEDGEAALLTLLTQYKHTHPQWTLAHLINTYAPPSENDSDNYVKFVAQFLGMDPSHTLGEIES